MILLKCIPETFFESGKASLIAAPHEMVAQLVKAGVMQVKSKR